MHLGVLLSHLTTLASRPDHERVHRPLYPVHVGLLGRRLPAARPRARRAVGVGHRRRVVVVCAGGGVVMTASSAVVTTPHVPPRAGGGLGRHARLELRLHVHPVDRGTTRGARRGIQFAGLR